MFILLMFNWMKKKKNKKNPKTVNHCKAVEMVKNTEIFPESTFLFAC